MKSERKRMNEHNRFAELYDNTLLNEALCSAYMYVFYATLSDRGIQWKLAEFCFLAQLCDIENLPYFAAVFYDQRYHGKYTFSFSVSLFDNVNASVSLPKRHFWSLCVWWWRRWRQATQYHNPMEEKPKIYLICIDALYRITHNRTDQPGMQRFHVDVQISPTWFGVFHLHSQGIFIIVCFNKIIINITSACVWGETQHETFHVGQHHMDLRPWMNSLILEWK